jgi:TolB-like protein
VVVLSKFSFLFTFVVVFLFSGCFPNNNYINKEYKKAPNFSVFSSDKHFNNLNDAIIDLSNQLLLNIPNHIKQNNKIAITTFVNLEQFKNTSAFGRVISESLIDELHTKKFNIIDFRKQDAISVNGNGEFILTRDTNKIVDEIPDALILVGTYSILETNQIVINARILNNNNLNVETTGRVIVENYQTCKKFNLCDEDVKPKKACTTQSTIIEDCTTFDCTKNKTRDGK